MLQLNLALIGLGTVGQGFLELLHEQRESLTTRYRLAVHVVGIATARRGAIFCLDGLDIPKVLAHKDDLTTFPAQPRLIRGLSTQTTCTRPGVDVVVEVTPTDLTTGEPAISHVRAALAAGKHVITANKGPLALAYAEMTELATHRDAFLGFEGTVMGGTPVLRFARKGLAGCTIHEVVGIINGTTNYILTQMEVGQSYADVLAEAQRLGYAETNPAGDVEGYDAAAKLVIVANTALNAPLALSQVDRTGITGLTVTDIEAARQAGERWKLIARARRTPDGGVIASVRPERLPLSDPLAGVSGVVNAITYYTDMLGPVTITGAGAGGRATGYALLSDLIELAERG
jgi:homoserine dehydrogenase